MAESALILIISLLLDQLIGEPRRWHPLVGFGWCAHKLELMLNKAGESLLRFKGLFALVVLILPLVLLLHFWAASYWVLDIIVLYLAIGRKSLIQHAQAVATPLNAHQIDESRKRLSYIVSRDTATLDEQNIVTATIESVVENSNDAIFAAIFWYLVAGLPGVLCYRLVNTLDAMWGYKNKRFLEFGWAAARLDDVMNWLPARLTVFTFAVSSQFKRIVSAAFEQGRLCSSPNAGPVMAAGASRLSIRLGGDAYYQQKLIAKPTLGYGNTPVVNDISRAISLINKSLLLWLGVIIIVAILYEVF